MPKRDDTSCLIHRAWPPGATKIVAASGCRLRTADGRELLDAASGALSTCLGYGPTRVVEAVREQAARLPFVHSSRWTTEATATAAEALAGVLPGTGDDALRRVMFTTGGSESIELALQLAYRIQAARGEPERRLVIGRHLSYHGCTYGTLDLGARRALRDLVGMSPGSHPHVPPPYPYRPEWGQRFPDQVAGVAGIAGVADRPLSEAEIERGRADPVAAIEVAFEVLGPKRICALVAEPIIGASGGAVVPLADYWPRVRELCDRAGILWVADEVMCGVGRTGRWLASEHWETLPDVVALGKGLTGAVVPGGAVVTRERWWNVVASQRPGFPLGYTFAQHPLTAAAAHATIGQLRERAMLSRARQLGASLRAALHERLASHPYCGEIRGEGLMLAVEIVRDRALRAPFARDRDATGIALRTAEEHGVLFYPVRGCADGTLGDGFLVAPPLIVEDADIEPIVEAAARALEALPR